MQDPFLNIAPKKPNWDLRRDVQKKLDKLEKRTQKALHKLMCMLIILHSVNNFFDWLPFNNITCRILF